jgi:hypothetical protein
MTKTLDDYMNDPDIAHEPMALREIHAIRLKIHDETKGMTSEEYGAYVRRGAKEVLDRIQVRKTAKTSPAELIDYDQDA